MKWSIVIVGAFGMLITIKLDILAQESTMDIITRCGKSSGHSFFFPSGLIPGQSGWTEDKISDGQILLVYNSGNPDIIFSDATKQIQSALGGGAFVFEVEGGPPGFHLILSVHGGKGTIEHYLFGLDKNGNGTLAWGTVRSSALWSKSSLYTASCQSP